MPCPEVVAGKTVTFVDVVSDEEALEASSPPKGADTGDTTEEVMTFFTNNHYGVDLVDTLN